MAVSVAEYLAQRTDVDSPSIYPTKLGAKNLPQCPFVGTSCTKLDRSKPQPPICSVRTSSGGLWIVCSQRLIPSKANVITPYHLSVLGSIAEVLFPYTDPVDIGFRTQQGLTLEGKRIVMDYVLRTRDVEPVGRSRVILEIQGGGETSSTGFITQHVANWAASRPRTNAMLRMPIKQPSPIANNAWKRQLEQIFRKVPLAMRFDAGFALVMGEMLYDYITQSLHCGRSYFDEWEIALFGVGETPSRQNGPIPIEKLVKSCFMTFEEFIEAIRNFPLPEELSDPFEGVFRTLVNDEFDTLDAMNGFLEG